MTYNKKQHYDNSCGAATLLCAAMEIGVTHRPSLKDHLLFDGRPLECNTECETAIYQITSDSEELGLDLRSAGYSYPPRVVFTARLLGLDGAVYVDPEFIVARWLTTFYNKIASRCAGAGVSVHREAAPALGQYQRELRIVIAALKLGRYVPPVPAGLHYVLVRPDGSVMDPASGRTHGSFTAMQDMAPAELRTQYYPTGISIILSPGEEISDLELLFNA